MKPLDVSGLGAGELPTGMDRVQGLTWRQVSTTEQIQQVSAPGSNGMFRHGARAEAYLAEISTTEQIQQSVWIRWDPAILVLLVHRVEGGGVYSLLHVPV